MSRLVDDIAALDRIHAICAQAIDPPYGASVPPATLNALADEVRALMNAPREYRLFTFSALIMVEAAKAYTLARLDADEVMTARWRLYAVFALNDAALDLENARKSAGEFR
jgi:hypothetical protein